MSVMCEERLQHVRVDLSRDDWQVARAALGAHGIVSIKGIFHRGICVHRIVNIDEFKQAQKHNRMR